MNEVLKYDDDVMNKFINEFGDQINERLNFGWEYCSMGEQAAIRQEIKMSVLAALRFIDQENVSAHQDT